MESAHPGYICELCQKTFSQISSRNRHVREMHLQPGLYQCKQCGLRFSKKYNLQVHVEHVHAKNLKQLKCSQCNAYFSKITALKKHIKDQHESDAICDYSNNDTEIGKELDIQTIAESVLKELKQLQKDIEPLETVVHNHLSTEQEFTDTEKSSVKDFIIKDKLYPLGNFTQIKVQTIKRKDGVIYFICEFCNKEFKKTYNYLRHRRIHTKVRPFICVLCKKSFPTTAHLKTHCVSHKFHDAFGIFRRLYQCPQCNKSFSAMQHLDEHLSAKLNSCNVTFKCPQCFKSFKTLKTLLRHKHLEKDKELQLLKSLLPKPLVIDEKEKFAQDKQSNFECNFCGLKFKSRILLEQHEKRHENLFKYQCIECQASFASQAGLKFHINVHSIYKSYKCHYCKNVFKTAQSCRSHMMTHLKLLIETNEELRERKFSKVSYPTFIENERKEEIKTLPITLIKSSKKHRSSQKEESISSKDTLKHKCSECEMSFRYKAWLKKHFQYKHTIDLPFDCSKCLRKFRTKQSLENHTLVHSTQRVKLICQVCGRQYASSKSLKLHLRIHTQEKPFSCTLCDKQFRTSGHHIQHWKSNHQI